MKSGITRIRLLQITLAIGSLYYLIGAIAHFFGLTLFPWYDGHLHSVYHDTIITMAALLFSMLLAAVARDPVKNEDGLKVIKAAVIITTALTLYMLEAVDFAAIGAPDKYPQAVVETVLLVVFYILLTVLSPRTKE